jgi:hypothetical protein
MPANQEYGHKDDEKENFPSREYSSEFDHFPNSASIDVLVPFAASGRSGRRRDSR